MPDLTGMLDDLLHFRDKKGGTKKEGIMHVMNEVMNSQTSTTQAIILFLPLSQRLTQSEKIFMQILFFGVL